MCYYIITEEFTLEINVNKDLRSINWNIKNTNANVTRRPLCNEFRLKKLKKPKKCKYYKPLQFKRVRF